ncbi:MAG: hypothetical protein U0359_08985 [Byssovorax sp.]
MRIRRDTRRRLDQFIANPGCGANVLSAVHDIPMREVARSLGLDPEDGQSPFAITRGKSFERTLYADGAERLFEALIRAGVLPAGAAGFVDLRLTINGGTLKTIDEAKERFLALLQQFAAAGAEERMLLPSVIAAPALQIPGRAILPDGLFAVDVVTVHPEGMGDDGALGPIVLRVGEIKVYPDRGGYTDPHELASTRAQAGVYVHALRLAVDAAGLGGSIEVATDGFLVLTRPGFNAPRVRAKEDLRYQEQRAADAFERLRAAAAEALPLDGPGPEVPDLRLAAVRAAPRAYDEACVSFCELESFCHARALDAGEGAALGRDVARFLGSISLHRAVALLDGARAETAAEEDFVRRSIDDRRAGAA